MANENGKCPVTGRTANPTAGNGTSNRDWWPNQINLKVFIKTLTRNKPM